MTNDLLLPSHYLPSILYFKAIIASEANQVQICTNERYVKQSFRNRTRILGPHQVEQLIIPVHAHNHQLMKDVIIDERSKWARNHWKTIENCYRKAPFFEYYEAYLFPFYTQKNDCLIAFNSDLLKMILRLMQVKKSLIYRELGEATLWDISAKKHETWIMNGEFKPYAQNFGTQFVENLSILDLLFMQGPQAIHYLK
ncbi:MAG: WbqC family protein [Spirosomataceae bacterium]